MFQTGSDFLSQSKGLQGNNQRHKIHQNLNLNLPDNKQKINDLLNSLHQDKQKDDKFYQVQGSQKYVIKQQHYINSSKTDIHSSNDNSPYKIYDNTIPQKNITIQTNNSFGSDTQIQKQNSNNSSEKCYNEKSSPSKLTKSKFNYLINESPLQSSQNSNTKIPSGKNGYLINNNDFNLDLNTHNREPSIQSRAEMHLSKIQTQSSEITSSTKQNTKQQFFQKSVTELNSPLTQFPNQKLNSYGLSRETFYTNINVQTHLLDQQRAKSKQLGNSTDYQNSPQHLNYYSTSNTQSKKGTELPKLDTKASKSKSFSKLPLSLSIKQQQRKSKDQRLNSLSDFDDIFYEERTQNLQNKKHEPATTHILSSVMNKNDSKSMNFIFGALDRQSINHSQYQQRQKLLRQREKEEYMQEEVAKVKQLWQQYEYQRSKNKEFKQHQSWQKLDQDGNVDSPLKYQREEQIKDLKTKHIESKKQQFFNEMILSVKKSGMSSNQNTSLVQSPIEGQGFLFSARKTSNTFNSSHIPYYASQQKEEVNSQSPLLLQKVISEQEGQNTIQLLSTLQISKVQSNLVLNYDNDQNKEEGFWDSIHIWESIIKDSFELIKKEKIVSSQEFNYQLLLDFLNNVVGRNYSNNEKYMRESLKLIGFTPEVSEIVLERISRLMSEKYGISNDQISKFCILYNQYEKEYLSWNLIDRMGGKERIDEVISTYIQLVNTNPSISGALRLLNISSDMINLAFNQLLHFEERRHKQYFKHVQYFFKQPLYRISHTKFFFAAKFYLERALFKNKIQPQYKNRLYLLIEQMRYFVTLPLPQDANFLLPKQNKPQINDESSSPILKNQNENKVADQGVQVSAQKADQNQEDSNDELTNVPQFCYQIAAIIRNEMMGMIKIKQALIKHQQMSLHHKVVFEQYLMQLIQVFALNNNDSLTYFEIKNLEKYKTILLLTDDFFYIFSKLLMENIVRNLNCSTYFSKDTHKRLQHVKIQLNKITNFNSNSNANAQKDSQSIVQANIDKNYLNGACFFQELFNHPNPMELILDKLDDIYHYKSELNKLCPISKVSRSRDLCRHILSYFYPFIDQNGYPIFISSFDFQCYVSQKKLKQEFFLELKKVLKDLFLNNFNFPITLVQRLIQEYLYALQGIEVYSKSDNGNLLFGIRNKQTSEKDLNYNNQYDDEKLEF